MIARRAFAALALALLAACSRTPPPPPVQADPADAPRGELPPDNVRVSGSNELVGTWYHLPADADPHRGNIALVIDRDSMVMRSGCVTMAWTYRVADGQLQVAKAPVASCVRGLTPREERFAEALGGAIVAYHRGGRGLVFEGPKGRLVLSDRPADPAPGPVLTLAGEWRVAAIDGRDYNEDHGIALSASDREIWWSPRCAGYARSYRIAGASFSTGPYLGWEPPRPGVPPPPVCLIAPPARIGEVFDVLAAATSIRRTDSNGVEISGAGRSLLLFSQ